MRIVSRIQGLALGLLLCAAPQASKAGIAISVTIAPPVIPVYTQPPIPQDGYLWTPGYWAYGPDGYFWVPGVWVAPPRVGVLWTPGYWGFGSGAYMWHAGYWGPHVGFYGGVNYGFGYGGVGFGGGVWMGGGFRYNTAVLNVGSGVVHNTYIDRTVINNTTVNRVSFNGPGGVNARPTPEQMAAEREPHIAPTANQMSHQNMAASDRSQLASVNHGRPSTVAMDSVNGHRFNQQGRAGGSEQNSNRQVAANRPANPARPAAAERRQTPEREQNGGGHPAAKPAPAAHKPAPAREEHEKR